MVHPLVQAPHLAMNQHTNLQPKIRTRITTSVTLVDHLFSRQVSTTELIQRTISLRSLLLSRQVFTTELTRHTISIRSLLLSRQVSTTELIQRTISIWSPLPSRQHYFNFLRYNCHPLNHQFYKFFQVMIVFNLRLKL